MDDTTLGRGRQNCCRHRHRHCARVPGIRMFCMLHLSFMNVGKSLPEASMLGGIVQLTQGPLSHTTHVAVMRRCCTQILLFF